MTCLSKLQWIMCKKIRILPAGKAMTTGMCCSVDYIKSYSWLALNGWSGAISIAHSFGEVISGLLHYPYIFCLCLFLFEKVFYALLPASKSITKKNI